jgi:SAM-dependent methyltransferase
MNPSIRFDDVADLYDFYVNVDFDIGFFLNVAKKIKGSALELTCGTGRVSIPLLQAGVDLTCIDYSPGMLRIFRKKLAEKNISCDVILMDITRLNLRKRFELIFIPFNSIAEIVDRSKHLPTLKRIKSHLAADGRFICTLHNPSIRIASIDGTLKTIGRFPMYSDHSLVVKSQLEYDNTAHIARGYQFYEIYDGNEGMVKRKELEIRFYLFTRSEFEQLIHEAGFEIEAIYGDYRYTPFNDTTSPYMIWILKSA